MIAGGVVLLIIATVDIVRAGEEDRGHHRPGIRPPRDADHRRAGGAHDGLGAPGQPRLRPGPALPRREPPDRLDRPRAVRSDHPGRGHQRSRAFAKVASLILAPSRSRWSGAGS